MLEANGNLQFSRESTPSPNLFCAPSNQLGSGIRARRTVPVASLAKQISRMVLAGVGPARGPRNGIILWRGPVDIDKKTRLLARVDARNLNQRRRAARARPSNLELRTAHIMLGTAELARTMQTDMLAAHEVVARGQLLGQLEGEVVDARGVGEGGPVQAVVRTDIRRCQVVDFEPVAVTLVLGGGGAVGGFAHVDGRGARVAELGVDVEADDVAGADGARLGCGHDVGVQAALVADHVRGGWVGDGAVGVGRAADEFVRAGDLVVHDQGLEVVMGQGRGEGRQGPKGESSGSHLEDE